MKKEITSLGNGMFIVSQKGLKEGDEVTLGSRGYDHVIKSSMHNKPDRTTHKYEVGETLELFGMQDYPEFDGEQVEVVAYRKPVGDELCYYISSGNPNIDKYLNYVYEKRLRPVGGQ